MTTQNIFDLVDTWNAGATTFTAVKMNVTDTASDAASLLMDLQVGSVSAFNVSKGGSLKLGLNAAGTNVAASAVTIAGSQGTGTGAGGSIVFEVAPLGGSGSSLNNLVTFLEATSTRAFRLYNTTDVTTNFERGVIKWNSNVLEIGTEAGGTGTNRLTRFISAAGSSAWEFKSTGTSTPNFTLAGSDRSITLYPQVNMLAASNGGFWSTLDYGTGGSNQFALRQSNANASTYYFGLIGSAAGVMQLNNGTGRGTGYGAAVEMWEMTAPSAPATNGVRIYAEDNGSGKTRLMALFNTAPAVEIAIEP